VKVATWNVNSIKIRLEQMLAWLDETATDVLCLQETKCVDEGFPYQAINQAGYQVAFFGQKSYNGVAILSKYEIENIEKGFPDDDGESPKRLIAATTGGVRIVNTYIPNGTELFTDKFAFKLDWIARLRRYFDETCDLNDAVLLCGDFNVAPSELDVWNVPAYEGKLHFSRPERAALHHLKQWGFVDVFRQFNPDEREFSWWDFRSGAWQRNRGLRIDHIWVSPTLAERALASWIDRDPRAGPRPSDHTPVVAEFSGAQISF